MYIVAIIISYLLGSIPTGYIIGKWLCNIDIRQYGSKNIGTTNMFRTLGAYPASVVLVIDVLKGVLAVLVGGWLLDTTSGKILAGAFAIIGHNYSCWLGFRGGRGVATSLGLVVTLMPKVALVVFSIWVVIVFITRYVSLASIIAAFLTPILAYWYDYDSTVIIFSLVMALLIIVAHKDNIQRLRRGEENKIRSGSISNIK